MNSSVSFMEFFHPGNSLILRTIIDEDHLEVHITGPEVILSLHQLIIKIIYIILLVVAGYNNAQQFHLL